MPDPERQKVSRMDRSLRPSDHFRTRRIVALAIAVGLAGIVGVLVTARPVDARLAACGASGSNAVDVTFSIPAANRIWDFVPGLQESPELNRDDLPAFVVLFEGTYRSPFGGTIKEGVAERVQKTYENVICVVQADGTINLYADVSRVGLALP